MLRKLPILLCMLALIISFSIDYTQKRDINYTLSPINSDKNTAIFAGYSEDGKISDYVVTYLKKLKEIAPNIIYVTDNPLSKSELRKIKPYANHVIAHRHGEYDWGSFKRGYNWLKSNTSSPVILEAQNETSNRSSSRRDVSHSTSGIHKQNIEDVATSNAPALAHPKFKTERDSVATGGINCHAISNRQENLNSQNTSSTKDGIKCSAGSEFATAVYEKRYIKEQIHNHESILAHPLLILANDSTITLAESFKPLLNDMQQKQADVYGITANIDGTYHIQSYFMILNEKAYTNPNFAQYLNNVKKEKDGLTVAYRYEVPFTQYMQNLGYKTATYIPYESLQHLPLNDKNCYPLTLISQHNMPLLKMRTFTNRLTVQEPRRLVFSWLKKHKPQAYKELIKHLTKIKSPYLSENK